MQSDAYSATLVAQHRERFLQALAAEDLTHPEPQRYPTVLIAGLQWMLLAELSATRGDERFEVALRQFDGFRWRWERRLQTGDRAIYVQALGAAPTIREAAAAAASYQPVIIKGEHLGQEIDWYETPRRWVAAIGGDEATISEMDRAGENGPFLWTRRYDDGSPVIKLFAGQALQGTAQTRDAAMIACVEAPERFRLAVAAMAARFYPRKAP